MGTPSLFSLDAAGTTVVNQVQREYDGLGQLTREYQEHSGAADTATTLHVDYGYSDLAHGSRLASMTYPNGREIDYNYGTTGSLDDTIGRLTSLSDSSGTLEAYTYLGLGTVVVRSHPQPGIDLTYIQQSGDTLAIADAGDKYTGLDRFGRVLDQNWVNTGTGNSVDRYQYAYDRDSNRTAKNNLVAEATTGVGTSLDETYSYDNLSRLASMTRGGAAYQSWALDGLGNMDSVTTGSTTVDRTHNSQNQLTSVGANTLAFDSNGNTTTDDQGHTLVYDAWNRLVAVNNGATLLGSYTFDGAGRRITANIGTATDLYYASHQNIEERQGGAVSVQNVFSPVYQNAIVLRDDGSERLYFGQDAIYNVTVVFSDAGIVQQRMAYNAGGKVAFLTASWNSSSNVTNIITLFQGMQFDSVIGFYFTDTRVYSPTMMVWNRPDELGYVDGANTYEFVHDDTLNGADPTGRSFLDMPIAIPGQDLGVSVWNVSKPQRLAFNGYKYSDGVPVYPEAHWRFSVHAELTGLSCGDLEYRQYVKGYLKINGSKQIFADAPDINEVSYVEDHSKNLHFGHRNEMAQVDDHYSMPNGVWSQPKGMNYDMWDAPGTKIDYTWFWGTTYAVEIHLDFNIMILNPSTNIVYKHDHVKIYDSVELTAEKVGYPSNWKQIQGGWA